MLSLQERYAPNSSCFGCGPRNLEGLRIRSFPSGHELVADWTPRVEHQAFSGFLSGGILSVLLDCHGNWTAAYTMMRGKNLKKPPGSVTAEYSVRFPRPTPMVPLRIRARTKEVQGNRAIVVGEVVVSGQATASMEGTFVAVSKGHPAFNRWR